MYKNNFKGFTLIELLMVISIITLISSVFFSYVGSASAKSRDSVRLSDMKQINTAATMYYEDKGNVPDSIETLVSSGYLSAVPVDPKTKESYTYKTGVVNGKKVFTVKAKYEKIYTTNTAGEEVPQQVGVIVGDIDLSQICSLVSSFAEIFGSDDDKFPTCDSSNTSNDQIVGYSSGHRSGGSRSVVGEEISNCLEDNVSLKCPTGSISDPCYCGDSLLRGGIKWQYPNPMVEYNWDGAKKYCTDRGMMLPTIEQLRSLSEVVYDDESFYWTNEEYFGHLTNPVSAYFVILSPFWFLSHDKIMNFSVRCVHI